MIISKTMIKSHIWQITLGYFVDHSEMPEDLSEFDILINSVRLSAEQSGDTEWLCLGLQYLLHHPQAELNDYNTNVFPLERDEMRALMWHLYMRLAKKPAYELPIIPITLEEMTGEEWNLKRPPTPRP